MKKIAAALLAALGYIGLLCYVLPGLLPDWSRIIPSMETISGSNILLAENKKYCSNLYEIEIDGSVNRVYSRMNKKGEAMVGLESNADGRVYCIFQSGSTGVNRIKITQMNGEWTGERVIGELEYESRLLITSSTIIGDKLYFTALDDNEWQVILYSCLLTNERGVKLVKEMQWELPAGDKITDAAFDGKFMYVLANNGRMGYFIRESYRYFPLETQMQVEWMEASSGGLLYSEEYQDSVWYRKDTSSLLAGSLPACGLMDADCIENGGRMAALVRGEDYSYSLYWDGGTVRRACSGIRFGWDAVCKLCVRSFLGISIAYLLVCMAVLLLIRAKGRYRSVTGTMVAAVILINTLFVAVLTIYIYQRSRHYLQIGRQISCQVYTIMEADHMNEGIRPDEIDVRDFVDTEWAEHIDEILLGVSIMTPDTGSLVRLQMDLVYCGEEEAYMLNSRYCVTGRPLYSYYEPGIEGLVRRAREEGKEESGIFNLRQHTYLVYVIPGPAEDIFFVSMATMDDLDEKSRLTWQSSLEWACIYGVASALLIVFVLYRQMRPVRTITASMEKVAVGINDLPEERFPDNEYGRMWISLHKMCKALRMQEYEREKVVRYYSRFAPKKFEELFGKEALHEVAAGDIAVFQGTLGIISVAQKEELLKKGMKKADLQYISSLMECISKSADNWGGILITNDGSIELTKVIFREPERTADMALQAGIDSLRRLHAQERPGFGAKPLVLLHNGSFTCGLAGVEAQTYPFVESLEIELLSNYTERLKQLGVRLAITGQVHDRLRGDYQQRYIGHVVPEPGKRFDFYEILNACGKQEREQKLELAAELQEGIALYEQGRFRECGRLLMGIARRCPLDSVAKWYLFACEEKLSPSGMRGGEEELLLFDWEDAHGGAGGDPENNEITGGAELS